LDKTLSLYFTISQNKYIGTLGGNFTWWIFQENWFCQHSLGI